MTEPSRRAVLAGLAVALIAARAAPSRASALIAAARRQVGVTLRYDPDYTAIRAATCRASAACAPTW